MKNQEKSDEFIQRVLEELECEEFPTEGFLEVEND